MALYPDATNDNENVITVLEYDFPLTREKCRIRVDRSTKAYEYNYGFTSHDGKEVTWMVVSKKDFRNGFRTATKAIERLVGDTQAENTDEWNLFSSGKED